MSRYHDSVNAIESGHILEMNDDPDPMNEVTIKVQNRALPKNPCAKNHNRRFLTAIEAGSELQIPPKKVQRLVLKRKLRGRYHSIAARCLVYRKDVCRAKKDGLYKVHDPGDDPVDNTTPSPIETNDYPDPMNAIHASRILGTTPAQVQMYLRQGRLRGRYDTNPEKCQITRGDLRIFQDQYAAPGGRPGPAGGRPGPAGGHPGPAGGHALP